MRIQLIEHDPEDFSRTNISFWAAEKGYPVNQTYVCNNEDLPSIDTFDWLMVMGGSPHAWDEQENSWLREEKAFIREVLAQDKPFLGVCFGAQLLAEALGGQIFPNTYKEIGWHNVSVNPAGQASFLFQKLPPSFVSFHWHSDHFSLPRNCTRLADSNASENQAFVCNGRPFVGLQFHPEFTRDMIRHFARNLSHEWVPDVFVGDKDKVLAQTEEIPDTYWLMKTLLNNMALEFEKYF